MVIWHVYWLSTWWREDRLPWVNKQIATWRVMLKKRQTMWSLPYRQGSIHWSTFDVSRQLAERGEACLVRHLPRPLARCLTGWGEACLRVVVVVLLLMYALRPLPRPRARWLAGRGENFTTPFVYSSSLLRTLVSNPSIYLYKATIKIYILHLYKATNSNRDKSYHSLLSTNSNQFQNLSNQGRRWVVELIS